MQIINNEIIQNNFASNSNFTTQVNTENKTVSFESYLNAINEVQSVKNSAYSQSNPKIDYSNYNYADFREIPYEEAKLNINSIKERLEELYDGNQTLAESNDTMGIETLLNKLTYSDNDKLNKGMYETLRAIKDPVDTFVMSSEIQTNLQDYYYGKPVNASFVVSNNDIHAHENLTRAQLNSINVEDFLSKMVGAFTEDYVNAPISVKNQYKQIIDGYNLFQQNYNQTKKEPYYA